MDESARPETPPAAGRVDGYLTALGLWALLPMCRVCPAAPGLPWVRFNSASFTRPLDTGVADNVDVDTGTSFNDYSQIWLGLIDIPTEQPITFSAEADNGLRLFLDGKLVIDGWGMEAPREGHFRRTTGTRVPLRLEYYQDGGVGHVRLYWQWEGHAREIVAASAFFHSPTQKAELEAMGNGMAKPAEDRSVIYPGSCSPRVTSWTRATPSSTPWTGT